MSTRTKKVQTVELSPIGEYCEAMKTEVFPPHGKTISADITKSLSMMQEADGGVRDYYQYLEFCVRTSVRSTNFDELEEEMKYRLGQLFAGIKAYRAALDAVMPRSTSRRKQRNDHTNDQ